MPKTTITQSALCDICPMKDCQPEVLQYAEDLANTNPADAFESQPSAEYAVANLCIRNALKDVCKDKILRHVAQENAWQHRNQSRHFQSPW